ncbi:MAG: disulfide bond formation protein B [Rhizobiales bacterium]|nr:disulfide bond formation protein B [Rhizobacter sp.]
MSASRWFAGIGLVCVAAVGAALVSQHVYGMQPCPWCVLQRVIFLAIAAACVIGLVWRSAGGFTVAGGIGLLLAGCGIAAAAWQHFQAAASASCNLTLADKIVSGWLGLDSLWPDVFSPRASCAEAAVNLLGVPYDFWSLAVFGVVALALLRVLRDSRRG